MIDLIDVLRTAGVPVCAEAQTVKVHLACYNGIDRPIDVFFAGEFDEWQASQNKRNFECKQVLSLIDRGSKEWLFVGLYQVHGIATHSEESGRCRYDLSLLPGQEDLIARLIVRYERTRASYVWLRETMQLPVVEYLRQRLSIGEFPGHNAVRLTHAHLRIIVEQGIESWRGALSHVKGVYLIVDTTTGRQYVGKASGGVGIWQRWSDYAKTGHGGNVELRALLNMNGIEHAHNFQYSILEIADTHSSDLDILQRESYWMQVLRSREFGLNGPYRIS